MNPELTRRTEQFKGEEAGAKRRCRPKLDGVHFNKISDNNNATLIAPFEIEEIK